MASKNRALLQSSGKFITDISAQNGLPNGDNWTSQPRRKPGSRQRLSPLKLQASPVAVSPEAANLYWLSEKKEAADGGGRGSVTTASVLRSRLNKLRRI